jgi:hypothetical protein
MGRHSEDGPVTVEIRAVVGSDSGMLALWDAEPFIGIVDYESWEEELCLDDDIQRHVKAGNLVPINIGSDGAFQVLVRYGTMPTLTDREIEHLVVSSDPYLLVSSGEVRLSGVEHVGAVDAVELTVGEGEHEVVLHIIDWHAEPGSTTEDGKPSPHALPDFVALVSPVTEDGGPYRDEIVTFAPPGAVG